MEHIGDMVNIPCVVNTQYDHLVRISLGLNKEVTEYDKFRILEYGFMRGT